MDLDLLTIDDCEARTYVTVPRLSHTANVDHARPATGLELVHILDRWSEMQVLAVDARIVSMPDEGWPIDLAEYVAELRNTYSMIGSRGEPWKNTKP
ncbi:MAG: hypothetical protein ACYTFN_18435 [Planctomycetota bacterium]